MAEITAASHAEATQEEIDQEIHKLQASIRDLQSRRNALSPSCRLPPEILSKIFLFCWDPVGLTWINETTHICRHWRAVALECPGLWSSPDFSSPKWAEEMLKRSKMAPLTICVRYRHAKPDVRKMKTFLSTLAQISRIRELYVATDQTAIISKILTVTDPAPCLESLHLVCTDDVASRTSEYSDLPVAFLNGEAPRLRRLELNKFPISWDSPLMDNLVHLSIVHPIGIGSSVRGIVEALEKMPLLETLKLENVLGDTQQGASMTQDVFTIAASSTRVALKRLKCIRLAATKPLAIECADILSHLSYPPTTMASIQSTIGLDTASLFALVQAHYDAQSPANFKEIRSLYVLMTSDHMGLDAWTSRAPSGQLPVTVPLLKLNLASIGLTQAVVEELLRFTCNTLALRRLRILKFVAFDEMETKTWITAFTNLPMLETIHVYRHADTFIAALQEHVYTDSVNQIPLAPNYKPSARQDNPQLDGVSGFLCFPALRNLILESVDFEEPTLDNLETALMARCEWQQELWTLKLRNCLMLTNEAVNTRLSSLVVEVDWDGKVQRFVFESDDEYDHN